jgi:hypothetical protein
MAGGQGHACGLVRSPRSRVGPGGRLAATRSARLAVRGTLDEHATLFPRLAALVGPGGVLAVQMPRNFSEPSHTSIHDTVRAGGWARTPGALDPSRAHQPGRAYPSLPQNDDFNRLIGAAEVAWDEKRGAWSEFGADLLLAYEYRGCIKLGTAETPEEGIKAAFQRVCVDLRNLTEVGLFAFDVVPPPIRLWVWQTDLQKARVDLGL